MKVNEEQGKKWKKLFKLHSDGSLEEQVPAEEDSEGADRASNSPSLDPEKLQNQMIEECKMRLLYAIKKGIGFMFINSFTHVKQVIVLVSLVNSLTQGQDMASKMVQDMTLLGSHLDIIKSL